MRNALERGLGMDRTDGRILRPRPTFWGPQTGRRPLKDLAEHNAERLEKYEQQKCALDMPTGLACPQCAEKGVQQELVDPTPGQRLMSDPPKRHVICRRCNHLDYALV